MAKKVLRYTEEEFVTLLENIVKKVKAEQSLNENFFRFDIPNDKRWFDIEDNSYDELPEGDYEDKEYDTYEEYNNDFPEHKHFNGNGPKGSNRYKSSEELFNRYKNQNGPLKAKLTRPNLGENRTNPKKPLNNRYTKLK